MKLEGWEEVEQDNWVTLPLQIRATITFSDPYKVIYIASSKGLKKLKQDEDERTNAETATEGMEGSGPGAEDSEAQH